MVPLLAAALLACSQGEEPRPSNHPFDRVVALELGAADPSLVEGRGPTAVVDVDVTFTGLLHVWTRSELDLFLRADDAEAWTTLAEDEDSGGGTTPYLCLEVREGQRLAVFVCAPPGAAGAASLHLVASPESEGTRAAAAAGRAAREEALRRIDAGDRPGARAVVASAVERLASTAGAASSELVCTALQKLIYVASTELGSSGEHIEAERLVLRQLEHARPPDHAHLLAARADLALSMKLRGDLAGARALQESVLAALERTRPEGHRFLLATRLNLASSMNLMGDVAAARALEEAVLAELERAGRDDPMIQSVRMNLAASMLGTGDVEESAALYRQILADHERDLPADHPELLLARTNVLATTMLLGDSARALELARSLVASYERSLPAGHPDLLFARTSLANALETAGELAAARTIREEVLAGFERIRPPHDLDVLRSRADVIRSWIDAGELDGARAQTAALCAALRTRALGFLALAPREVRQAVGAQEQNLGLVLLGSELSALDPPVGEAERPESAAATLRRDGFELLETLRLVAGEAARALARFDTDPELAPILRQADEVRRALNDLVAGAARGESGGEAFSAELTRLSLERDRLERAASLRLAERGVVARAVEAQALAAALGPRDLAVGYRRIALRQRDPREGFVTVGEDRLLAHVLQPDGSLARLDLGPAAELEALAGAWRAALGAPLLRGVAAAEREGDREARAGALLRERLLDPILEQAGADLRRLYVCADDLVFLLPLDALPLDEQGRQRVGDRLQLVNEVSFARLLAGGAPAPGEPSLLALGGADYEAAGSAPGGLDTASAPIDERDSIPAEAAASGGTRRGLPARFAKLLQSRYEAEAVADLFEEALGGEPLLLTRAETTKAALFAAAPGKRFLHLATHGWFAPESVPSSGDVEPQDRPGLATLGPAQRAFGLAPMTLCGLALAGANRGRDSLGRVTGILTAEELCTLDLSACELAVLSACETNVGIRRAGQGIQSLQAALYAAGARSSITSLWKVDDAATRRLFELFYTKLWEEQLPKTEALWQAKRVLRDEGAPVRDWAAWVLTGDPD